LAITNLRVCAPLVAALLLSACQNSTKSGAAGAKTAAERAVKTLREEATQFDPERLKELTDVLSQSDKDFKAARYADVMVELKDFPSKLKELGDSVSANKKKAEESWKQQKEDMPGLLETVETAMIDQDLLTKRVNSKLAKVKLLWAEAEGLKAADKLGEAVAKAKQAREAQRALADIVMPEK